MRNHEHCIPLARVLVELSVIQLWDYLDTLLHVFLADTNYISALASGPYGLIFASFIPFFLNIPITSRFRIFGVNFSDKSFIYLAGLQVSSYQNWTISLSFTFKYYITHLSCFSWQLLLSSWKRSLIPGICGLIAGLLYRLNVLGIRRMKVIIVFFYLCSSV